MDSVPASAMALMLLTSLVAAACALAAGRALPWQGRQAAVAMPLGMLALLSPGIPALAVAGVWMLSAMLGTAGLRGRPESANCCHRALGLLAMVLTLVGGGVVAGPAASHAAHGLAGGLPALAAVAVIAVVVWSAAGVHHGAPERRTRRLLIAEAWAISVGLVGMLLLHAIG